MTALKLRLNVNKMDGDHLFVCSNKIIIEAAKKVIKKLNICPLYYEMKKADSIIVDSNSLFRCMEMAFNSKSIGYYSNAITKIWNIGRNDDWSLTDEQVKVIKLLVGENNFQIDYFKSMYMPTRPKKINYIISKYLNVKVPRFFEYAKNYEEDKVDTLTDTPVNNIPEVVKIPRIQYGKYDFANKFDYREFLSQPMTDARFNQDVVNIYRDVINSSRFDKKQNECVKDYSLVINRARNKIYSECKKIGVTNWHDIIDSIVEEIFHRNPTGKKKMFWEMFGSTMYQHFRKDFDDELDIGYCIDCGEEYVFQKGTNRCRCKSCQDEHTLVSNRNDMRGKYTPVDFVPTKICVECGTEFEVSAKSKRVLCDCCYEKDLRKRKTATMQDIRNRLW